MCNIFVPFYVTNLFIYTKITYAKYYHKKYFVYWFVKEYEFKSSFSFVLQNDIFPFVSLKMSGRSFWKNKMEWSQRSCTLTFYKKDQGKNVSVLLFIFRIIYLPLCQFSSSLSPFILLYYCSFMLLSLAFPLPLD